ncbi:dorsal root ganglia homeobox protein-like [Eleutherodactylus coqui]|uniref:dorsal root ganglia homeobox protein-like n=1 Tax=Eleutherodactylus coqui TaxID=57060 RepID=UPI003463217D
MPSILESRSCQLRQFVNREQGRWFGLRNQKGRTRVGQVKKNVFTTDQRGPESWDDRSAADTECLLNQIQLRTRTVFPEEQQKILLALFKKKPYLSYTEVEQLANQLSVSRRKIQTWFQYRRDKMRHEALNPKKTPVQDQAGNSKTPTQAQQDLQHKQKMEASIKCVQAQEQSYLDSFPPLWPMESYVLPQGPHSSNMVYCQNVGGPPDSCCGTEVCQMPPESGHKPPNALHFNLPGTNIWTPESSITTDLMSDDGPSTSSAPSTSQMPIAWDDAGSSTDPYLLTDVETTDSDWENCSPC